MQYVILYNASNQICDPIENPSKRSQGIRRCIGGDQGIQRFVNKTLLSMQEGNEALKETIYDTRPHNTQKQ